MSVAYASATGAWWGDLVALWLIVSCATVFGWALSARRSRGREGTLDLTAAAARGELDLDWADPRTRSDTGG